MQDPETGNWIVFNGEIYNFREVRQKLESEGTQFRSQSDTEVLLKAYARWGERCLDELRGMFAFAIWDAVRHRLFLARDPMGIKPLYYCSQGQYFLFASEVRTLLGTGLVPRQLDRAGLLNYLSFGSVYDPVTLIQGISNLRAGHYLVWEKGSAREVRYWDLVREPLDPSASERSALEDDLHATLDESVRMQTVSDVPVGVFLSGGIDSSSVAGILSRAGSRVSTFSIVFGEAEFSEAAHSRLVAKKFGTDHHEILVSPADALQAIPNAVQAMDQPTIDGLNTFLISKQVRAAGVKVVLSGLGGDELFAGYSTFRTVPRMERFAHWWRYLPRFAQSPLAGAFGLFASRTDQTRKLLALARTNGAVPHPYFLARMLFTPDQAEDLAEFPESAIEHAGWSLKENLQHARDLDPINRVSYLEARCYMLNTLLRDSDVMSMAHGLELRVPLIDHRLAEKIMRMPGAWKLDERTPKPLLVGALGSALPETIVYRKKLGFTLPVEYWLRHELRNRVEEGLKETASGPLSSVVDTSGVESIWQAFLRRETSWSRPWGLYVLQEWCRLNAVTI
jgi:asparagine synthase (glutamine-hydrolysing)